MRPLGGGAELDHVALGEIGGVAFRNREAQEHATAADHRHRLARGDDRSARDGDGKHDPRLGRQHRTFIDLLLDDQALGFETADLALEDIYGRPKRTKPLARNHAAVEERLPALEVSARRLDLRRERLELRVDRCEPEFELVVDDEGDPCACLDAISLGHLKLNDGSADPRPRRHPVSRLDLPVDRLPLDDLARRERQDVRHGWRCRQCRAHRKPGSHVSHLGVVYGSQ